MYKIITLILNHIFNQNDNKTKKGEMKCYNKSKKERKRQNLTETWKTSLNNSAIYFLSMC